MARAAGGEWLKKPEDEKKMAVTFSTLAVMQEQLQRWMARKNPYISEGKFINFDRKRKRCENRGTRITWCVQAFVRVSMHVAIRAIKIVFLDSD